MKTTILDRKLDVEFEQIMKLANDVRNSVMLLDAKSARYLVDTYYQIQKMRIITSNQVFSQSKDGEPCAFLSWTMHNFEKLEKAIKDALTVYAKHHPIYEWLNSICGIGPVISAGLIANIDIEKVQTAGQIFTYAGLCPGKDHHTRGEKSPYNDKLKVLCWKIGQSFVKVSNNKNDVYGKIYKIRKEYESKKNENLDYKDQAKAKLDKYHIGKSTDAYKAYSIGILPPGHIQRRCERYATKMFLSHLFTVWYEMTHHEKPAKPFAIAILGHAHEIKVPNWDEDNFKVISTDSADSVK